MREAEERTNPHKKRAECRRKKQSASCFFGRRAGNPSAKVTKRPIEHAVADKAENSNAEGRSPVWEHSPAQDIDPLERELLEGRVNTVQT